MIFFFGGSIFTWLFLLVTVPAITMRLGAEETKSGTLETLLTAPVTDLGVVLGKYLGALAVYAACWLPTVLYLWVLTRFSDVDFGPVLSGYLGILLVGMLFTSVGLFTTFASRNQLVAAVTAIAILVLLFMLAILSFLVTDPFWKSVLEYVDLWTNLQTFAKGVVDTRAVVYLLSFSALFLALAHQALGARRWSR
jgi:ABC-2 type transport system permease protein